MVGIHAAAIHKLIAELRGDKYERCNPPTFAQNAGYLMPDRQSYVAIRFEEPEHLSERIAIFVSIVRDVGLPFMRSHSSLAAVLDSLKTLGSPSGYEERLSVAEYLLGNYDAAQLTAESHRSELLGEHLVLREDFEKFTAPFLARLAAERS